MRIEACEIDIDFDAVMNDVCDRISDSPIETVSFDFKFGDLIVFDAAEDEPEENKKTIKQRISCGSYNILTFFIESQKYSILLHRFDERE